MPAKKEMKRKSNKDTRIAQGKSSKSARATSERLSAPVIGVPVNIKNIKLVNTPKK